jgi:FtsP/CotA-like multicopper oxidase with cupredoxin domain
MKVLAVAVGAVAMLSSMPAQPQVIPNLPEVRGPFTLTAMYDAAAEHNAFAFEGKTVPPVIRVLPGGLIKLRYINNLPRQSDEECATARCRNMSNLHFHGLHVSPQRPQDDDFRQSALVESSNDSHVQFLNSSTQQWLGWSVGQRAGGGRGCGGCRS